MPGVRDEPETDACLRWHQMEIAYGPFERVFSLPPETDVDAIGATMLQDWAEFAAPTHGPGLLQGVVDDDVAQQIVGGGRRGADPRDRGHADRTADPRHPP